MNQQEKPAIYEDEINLYDYCKVIVKRKSLIIGLFLVAILASAIISFLMPKIYRGEVVLKLTTKELTTKELLSIIGKPDGERIKTILPKTHNFVSGITLNELKGSADKLQVFIESKNPDRIPDIIAELVEYMNNYPLIKRYVEQEKERLLKQSEELSKIIEDSTELKNNYKKMLTAGRLIPIGFNPIDLDKRLSDLKIEKIVVEQAIRNLKGMEIVGQLYVSRNPVKPRTTMNIALAGITSLFAGIFMVFLMEYSERVVKEKDGKK